MDDFTSEGNAAAVIEAEQREAVVTAGDGALEQVGSPDLLTATSTATTTSMAHRSKGKPRKHLAASTTGKKGQTPTPAVKPSLQLVTKLNTERNSGYRHCVLQLTDEPKNVIPQLLATAQTGDPEEDEEDIDPEALSSDGESNVDDEHCAGDPIPYRDAGAFEVEELPPFSPVDGVVADATGTSEPVVLASSTAESGTEASSNSSPSSRSPPSPGRGSPQPSHRTPRGSSTSPARRSTQSPSASRSSSVASRSSSAASASMSASARKAGVQWNRRVSVTRFDYRNAPQEIPITLMGASKSASPSNPRDLPIPLRRFSGEGIASARRSPLITSSSSPLAKPGASSSPFRPPKPILKQPSALVMVAPESPRAASPTKMTVPVWRLPTDQELEVMLRQSGLVMDEESGDVTLVTASDVQVNGVEVVVPAKPARTPSLAAKRSTDDFDHQATVMGRLSPPVLLPPPVVVTAGATSVTNNDVRRSKRRKTVT